jgi:nitrate/nitrite transport system substrate-binding protein
VGATIQHVLATTVAPLPGGLEAIHHGGQQGSAIGAGALFATLGHSGVWAAGSDKPEKEEVKIGFIPLTDCASVVMASVLGFDKKYGVKIKAEDETTRDVFRSVRALASHVASARA